VKISSNHFDIILSWYEYATEDSFHYGGSQLIFPEESLLIEKLKSPKNGEITLSDIEIEHICEWMHTTIHRKYGDAKYLVGNEKDIYFVLEFEFNRIEAIHEEHSQKLLKEKHDKEEEERIMNEQKEAEQLLEVADKMKQLELKNKFEDKFRAAQVLKDEMISLDNKYKKFKAKLHE
jgi:hypothetical protein